jgi:spore maturation protein CgeB
MLDHRLFSTVRLLIVGSCHPAHIGSFFASAARQLGLDYRIMDIAGAEASSRIVRTYYWHFCDKRWARLKQFGGQVLNTCAATQRNVVLTTGRAPLDRSHIEKLRGQGIRVVNYSTDDPWNPVLRASWFLSTLPSYDVIFTPRRATLDDFGRCGVRAVHYLPFAYDPEVHRPWSEKEATAASSDVLFVGGCDGDRLPLISALIDAGLELALFGGYWNRHSKTRPYWRGDSDQDTIRSASAATRVCLCLVRRANRDGHVMRSFEAAAIGGCVLAESTADHRELFGPDNHAVRYFRTADELVQQAKSLVEDAGARLRLSAQLRERLAVAGHTYGDRLAAILRLSNVDGRMPY